MSLHFTQTETAGRLARATEAVNEAGLDALLMFAPESHFWVCGYDTFGFAMFQCLVLTKDGELHLLTREPDLRQAQYTSTLPDDHIHIWKDIQGVNPAENLARLLAKLGVADGRLGWETRTAGLTAWNGNLVRAALGDMVESSDIMPELRRHKSAAEIDMHRRAASLSDDALDAALASTRAGAFEGDILADMQGAIFKGGGDYAGNEFIIGSGEGGLLCRYYSGRRHLDANDQLTLEWSGAYARYHAAMMDTIVVGEPSDSQRRMFDVCNQALEACEGAIRAGDPMGNVFDAHARVFDANGFTGARLNACGYGMGAIYNPIWVDFPMFYEGNPQIMIEGQVFFLHMILMDSDTGKAMTLGHSVLVTGNGIERLSRHKPKLLLA